MGKGNSVNQTAARRHVLRTLVEKNNYPNQCKLLKALSEQGFKITQPTLSKDLAKENIIFDKDTECYRFSATPPKDVLEKNLSDFYKHCAPIEPQKIVTDLKICTLNIKPGYADALAVEIKKYVTAAKKPYYIQFLPAGDTLTMLYNDEDFITELKRVLEIH